MVHLLFFGLAAVGLTAILVDGAVFAPFRRYIANEATEIRTRREQKNLSTGFSLIEVVHEILNCHQCCGFWAGLFCSPYLLMSESFCSGMSTSPRLLLNGLLTILFCGFVGSLLATLYLRILEYTLSYTIFAQRSTPPPPEEMTQLPESEILEENPEKPIDLRKSNDPIK